MRQASALSIALCPSDKKEATHIVGGDPPAVRVHAGHQMDPGVVDQLPDLLVVVGVLVAKVVGQVKEQLSTKNLISVHVGDVLELGLHCKEQKRSEWPLSQPD